MIKYANTTLALIACLFTTFFYSCGNEDEPSNNELAESIVGSWYGQRTYNNPASGQKFQSLSITFYQNRTGDLEYEAPTSYTAASFTYKINGDIIQCTGVRAYTDGDVETDFTMKLRIESDRLIPLDKYSEFILTRNGSIITDSNGNELTDQSSSIANVWIHEDRKTILYLKSDDTYEEYVLTSPGSKSYESLREGDYKYDYIKKTLTIGTSTWSITELTSTTLKVKNSDRTLSYTIGSKSDLPDKTDMKSYLCNYTMWSNDSGRYLVFNKFGGCQYVEDSKKSIGGYGHPSLGARGTYSITGSQVTCYYDDISWSGSSYYPDLFPGWKAGGTRTITYNITIIDQDRMTVQSSDGKTETYIGY